METMTQTNQEQTIDDGFEVRGAHLCGDKYATIRVPLNAVAIESKMEAEYRNQVEHFRYLKDRYLTTEYTNFLLLRADLYEIKNAFAKINLIRTICGKDSLYLGHFFNAGCRDNGGIENIPWQIRNGYIARVQDNAGRWILVDDDGDWVEEKAYLKQAKKQYKETKMRALEDGLKSICEYQTKITEQNNDQ